MNYSHMQEKSIFETNISNCIFTKKHVDKLHLAMKSLTSKQKKMLKLFLAGCTQEQMASTLNLNQSAVNLSIYGALVYKNKITGEIHDPPKRHGGIVRRLQKAISGM